MNRLREFREKADLNKTQLAKLVGCSDTHIGLMEAGERRIKRRMREALAPHLGVDPDDLRDMIPSPGTPGGANDSETKGGETKGSNREGIMKRRELLELFSRLDRAGQDHVIGAAKAQVALFEAETGDRRPLKTGQGAS